MTNSGDDDDHILEYKLAVADLRKLNDPLRLAHKVRHLGDAYYYAGQLSQAEPCYVEALSIYRSHDHQRPLDLANAIRSFAVLKAELGAAAEAQCLWEEAHDLYVAVEVPAGVAESAARLALLARHDGDIERSREWFGKALVAAGETDNRETQQFIRQVQAQIDNQHGISAMGD